MTIRDMGQKAQNSAVTVAEAITAVKERIAAAAKVAGRDPNQISLVAVSKGRAAPLVAAAAAAGITDFGENRVAEAQAKAGLLGFQPRWHLLGHLQRNKVKSARSLFAWIHSLDSPTLARALASSDGGPGLCVLLQVEFTETAARTGLSPEAAQALLPELREIMGPGLRGLMTIAPPGGDAVARPYFSRLRELRDRWEWEFGMALPDLSMGMSDDFEAAIKEGATMVRIGRAIFEAAGG